MKLNNKFIECPNATLHTSTIEKMNEVRKQLWTKVYKNPQDTLYLLELLKQNFRDCGVSIDNMVISIYYSEKIYSNSEIECKMWVIMSTFIKILHTNLSIDESMKDICLSNPSLLYNVTLNNNGIIMIKL
jgi:hypothetical protein